MTDLFHDFEPDRCTLCGQCFHHCPVLRLPLSVAKDEMRRLQAGAPTSAVLQKCESCMCCNLICPEHCNPAQLILKRWYERYQRRGLPLRAQYFAPHSRPNT